MSVMIFLVMYVLTLYLYVYRCWPERPAGMSPIARRIPRDFDPHGEGREEEELVRNL